MTEPKKKAPAKQGDKREKQITEPKQPRKPGESPKDEGGSSESPISEVKDGEGFPDASGDPVAESVGPLKEALAAKDKRIAELEPIVEELGDRLKATESNFKQHEEEAEQRGPVGAQDTTLHVTPAGHALGWKPSLPDFHDVPADVTSLKVADEVDPRNDMMPCYDQGQLGSCTANAIAAALEYNQMLDGISEDTPSRLFIYYMERVREGTVTTDSGAYGRDGFKVLRKTGAPPEELWPYDISKFAEKPDQEAYDAAELEGRIAQYVHPGLGAKVSLLERREAFQRVLSNKQTIAFGFTVYASFEQEWPEAGVMPMPIAGESVLGGHEVLMVGFLADYPEHVLCRNSWGEDWGLEGYFLMPWQFACDMKYASDWRSIYRPLGG